LGSVCPFQDLVANPARSRCRFVCGGLQGHHDFISCDGVSGSCHVVGWVVRLAKVDCGQGSGKEFLFEELCLLGWVVD